MSRAQVATLLPLLLGVPTLALYLAASLPGRAPWRVVGSGLRRLLRDRRSALLVAGMLGVIAANVALTAVDRRFTNFVGRDFAPDLHRLEGDLVRDLQGALEAPALTATLAWFYVVVYPVLPIGSLFVYHDRGDDERILALATAYFLNYVLAQPFYLLFPVTEPAYVAGSGVRPLIEETLPGFMDVFRATSGLDNCFPSLHTSLAVSVALVALSSPYRALRTVTAGAAAAIAFSTIYLGIHWAADLGAGLAFGWACHRLGAFVARRLSAPARAVEVPRLRA